MTEKIGVATIEDRKKEIFLIYSKSNLNSIFISDRKTINNLDYFEEVKTRKDAIKFCFEFFEYFELLG